MTTHYMDEADALCDRVALVHRGHRQALGTPRELAAGISPTATLEDVFRLYAGGSIGELDERTSMREVRSTRRTSTRLG